MTTKTRLSVRDAKLLPRISPSLDHPWQGSGQGGYLCRYTGKLTKFVMTGEQWPTGYRGICPRCGLKHGSIGAVLAELSEKRARR